MKKRSLQQLALNKKKISNLASHSVTGGVTWTVTIRVSIRFCTTLLPENDQQ